MEVADAFNHSLLWHGLIKCSPFHLLHFIAFLFLTIVLSGLVISELRSIYLFSFTSIENIDREVTDIRINIDLLKETKEKKSY